MSFWKRPPLDGVHAFYLNGMLRAIVVAMVGIFTPVFVYKLGLSTWGIKEGVMLVAGYYFVMRLVTLICDIPASRIIERIGFRKSVLVSLVLLAINLTTLIWSEKNISYLVISAIAMGINIPFYWVARNASISQDADKRKVGRQMGWMTTLEQIATMLGPLAAGLIIEKWGFNVLFASTIAILFVSMLPLLSMPPHVHKNGATLKGFWYFMTNRRYFHLAIGIGSRSVDDYSIGVIWPLAIFIIGIKTPVLGGIFSLVSLVCLAVRILMSKTFDYLHNKRDYSDETLFAVSAIGSSILWVVRLFVSTVSAILAVDLVGAIFGTTYSTMYIDYEQLGGMRLGNIAYWVYGEMLYSLMTMWLMLLVGVGAYFGIWKELAFLSSAFWLLISIVMARESNMRG